MTESVYIKLLDQLPAILAALASGIIAVLAWRKANTAGKDAAKAREALQQLRQVLETKQLLVNDNDARSKAKKALQELRQLLANEKRTP